MQPGSRQYLCASCDRYLVGGGGQAPLRGEVAWFRYADDLVICCEYERDALRVGKALGARLARYELALNEQKTRLVGFVRPRNGHPSPDVF